MIIGLNDTRWYSIVGIQLELGWFSTNLACEKAYLDPSKVIFIGHIILNNNNNGPRKAKMEGGLLSYRPKKHNEMIKQRVE